MMTNCGTKSESTPETYLKLVGAIFNVVQSRRGGNMFALGIRHWQLARSVSCNLRQLTFVQLIILHPELNGKTDGCHKIFSTVAYNFNKQIQRKRKETHKYFSMDSKKGGHEEVCQEDLLSNNISSSLSNSKGFMNICLMDWMILFGGLILILYVYRSGSVGEQAFKLCQRIGLGNMCLWIPGRELSLIEHATQWVNGWWEKIVGT